MGSASPQVNAQRRGMQLGSKPKASDMLDAINHDEGMHTTRGIYHSLIL
jgi:hypothetical protein